MTGAYEQIRQIEQRLLDCPIAQSSQVFEQASDELDEAILLQEHLAEEYLQIFVKVLSERALYQKPGVIHFLIKLVANMHKLTDQDIELVAKGIIENFAYYEESLLVLESSYFIASYCPHDFAKRELEILKATNTDESKASALDYALRVIERERAVD